MNNKKKLLIAGASTLGVAIVGFGAYAYFSDKDSETVNGTVGTVDITATDAVLSHTYNGQKAPDNINPGDNDPDQPGTPSRPGTDHELSFDINNLGSKSVITRSKITVTAEDRDGNAISAADLINIILSEKTDADNYVISKLAPLTYDAADEKLVYIVGGTSDRGLVDVLNGVGDNAERETGVDVTSMTKTFDIGLEKEVGTTARSVLEGATITFTVEVQAMQYRNTADSDWETLSITAVDMGGQEG